jgi:aspartate aminotransferase/aminotransferase
MYNIHRAAQRLNDFDSSVFQEVYRKQQALENPTDLSVGLPEGTTPQYIKDAGIRAIQEGNTFYTPANGIAPLREAIALKLKNENGIVVPASDVTIVPGLTTGLLLVYLAILNPGDEVMIMDPSYPPYHYLAPLAEAVVKRVPTLHNFQLDLEAIKTSITEKTKMIIINTPNNPTGAVYPKEDLLQLAAIAEEHNILIISDEMYESFIYEGEHFSIGSVYPNTLTMNGFSKAYAMTGWRLGYITGPSEIIKTINQLQQYAVFCSSSIAQYAALEALSRPTQSRESYVQKRQLVEEKLREAGYDVQGNDGAYYTFFRVPSGMNDLDFIALCADNNLLLLPGRAFSKDETFVRLSYGGTIEDVEKGLEIITNISRQRKII